VNPPRALVYGVLFSVPFWLLAALVVWLVLR
jgi:hypothetical protein